MFEDAKVKVRLDELKIAECEMHEYKVLRSRISKCFTYECTANPEPNECGRCQSEVSCMECSIYKNHEAYAEKLVVDVKALVRATRGYALYGKDVEADPIIMPIENESGGALG